MIYTLIFLLLGFFQSPPTGELTVKISGIKNFKGDIRVALYDIEKDFLSDSLFTAKIAPASGSSVTIKFTEIPYGVYAISVFHDENKNGKLDTGLFGIPKEGYGFGNDSMGTFGPPDFEDAAINLQAPTTIHSISLR